MTPEEKRSLKKLGRKLVEQRSQALRDRLREANPAPVGSWEWGGNYRVGTLRERQLRQEAPDKLPASRAASDFVLNPITSPRIGVPTYYIECSRCGDLLHSVPRQTVECSCKALRIDLEKRQFLVETNVGFRWVRLIGRGA
jgi:hypothetical protein